VPTEKDVVIIGGGPAGLAAAMYTGRAMMDTLVIERKVIGGQIAEAYDVDNYPGFPEGITGADLGVKMLEQAEKFGGQLRYEEVIDLLADGPLKKVVTPGGMYAAPIVIIASGADHRKLGVPGEQRLSGRGVSYCATCDGPFFRDKRLVVVGGGDAAMTEAAFLTRFASEVKLVHRRQGFRANATHVEEARQNEKIEFVLDTVVTEIRGEKQVEAVTLKNVKSGQESLVECEGVFVFIGSEPNTGFLRHVLPEHAGRVIPVDFNMETDVKGLYAIGDARKGSYRQVATAIGEAVTAAMHCEKRIKELLQDLEG